MNNKITEKEVQKAVDNCFWKKDVCGVDICSGVAAPCLRVIEKGECDTLMNLFSQQGDNNDD